jgi:phage terminase large subunit GpA-like protein
MIAAGIAIWAWGRGEECWAMDYIVIYGNPADLREWNQKLLPQLEAPLRHACGASMKLEAVAIDTGGHYTHQAYSFVRANSAKRYFGVKGDSAEGKPVKGRSSKQDVNFNGKVIARGVQLWMVGTDTAKDLLHGRFKVAMPGPGYVHLSSQLPPEFFKQITAESRVQVKTATGDRFRWFKPSGARNEVLDCTVYATFAAHALDLNRYTDRMWQRLESVYEGDLFDNPQAADEAAEVAEPAVQTRALPEPPAKADPTPAAAMALPVPQRGQPPAHVPQRQREW